MIIPPQLALYATQVWFKVATIAAIVLAIGLAGYNLGVSRVQAKWDQEVAVQTKERLAAEQAARTEEQRRVKEAQRVVDGSIEREAASLVRAARAERTVVSLRNDIARLNTRPAPSNAEATGYADEARTARELLGTCAKEYGSLAAEADGLRNQVTGLQQWVSHVTQ